MVRMQIRQPHPFLLVHGPEVRVYAPGKIPRLRREPFQQIPQLAQVALEAHRRRASATLLIQFLHGLESLRPAHRRPQRKPSQHAARVDAPQGVRFSLAHVQTKPVAQMTNHLVRRHRAPQTRAVSSNVPHPARNLFSVLHVPQIFHATKFYPTIAIFAALAPTPRNTRYATTKPVAFKRLCSDRFPLILRNSTLIIGARDDFQTSSRPLSLAFGWHSRLCQSATPHSRCPPTVLEDRPHLPTCPFRCPPGQSFKIKHIAPYWSALPIAPTGPDSYNLFHPEMRVFLSGTVQ